MNLPATVKVGPFTFSVILADPDTFIQEGTGKKLMGEVDYGKCTIRIANNLCDQSARQVLIHEMLHAVLNNAGKDDHNEEFVDLMATGVFQIANENSIDIFRSPSNYLLSA